MPKVLIIDDAPEIRKLGALAMAHGGYEVLTASGGNEGVALALSGAPDVILLDVQMPDLDGPATLRALQERPETAQIPVIFLTASVGPIDLARWVSLGARAVLSKPFRPKSLATEVTQVLEKESS